jgi:hypothetical protein
MTENCGCGDPTHGLADLTADMQNAIQDVQEMSYTEPPSEMRQWAANLWQLYVALTGEGFTEQQSVGHHWPDDCRAARRGQSMNDYLAPKITETATEQEVLDQAIDALIGNTWRGNKNADAIRRGVYPTLKKLRQSLACAAGVG